MSCNTLSSITKNQQGFTLIEVIVVIILLGVLTVVAFPKFLDFKDAADLAKVKATAAALQSSVKSANVRWVLNGSVGRVQNMQGFGDDTLDMSTIGYPIGVDKGNGNDNIGRQNKGCYELWNYLLTDSERAKNDTSETYQSYRHSSGRFCSFVYRANGDTNARTAAKLGVLYNSNIGSVEVCGSDVGNPC